MSEEEIASLQRRLLPVEAVMAQLSLGRSSVFDLISTNQLRSVKIGRRRLVPQVSVDEFVTNLLAASK
jgi:excisionase family DNA binding protein